MSNEDVISKIELQASSMTPPHTSRDIRTRDWVQCRCAPQYVRRVLRVEDRWLLFDGVYGMRSTVSQWRLFQWEVGETYHTSSSEAVATVEGVNYRELTMLVGLRFPHFEGRFRCYRTYDMRTGEYAPPPSERSSPPPSCIPPDHILPFTTHQSLDLQPITLDYLRAIGGGAGDDPVGTVTFRSSAYDDVRTWTITAHELNGWSARQFAAPMQFLSLPSPANRREARQLLQAFKVIE